MPTGDAVTIVANGDVAHYAGLVTCGSVWACPVCEAKILNERAQEISRAAADWDRAGNSVYMVTLTMPHDMGMRLSRLLPVIADGFRSVIRGRPWLRLKEDLGIVGTIRSVEVTHGANGWHPHLHVLMFIEDDPGDGGLVRLITHIRDNWGRFIVKAGYRPPSDTHGVVVERCRSAAEAGAYIAKTDDDAAVGNELARGDLKHGRNGHRTPGEILGDFIQTGDHADIDLYNEYELATQGHQRITWSKGLRVLLRAVERTDEEIAEEEVGGEPVFRIDKHTWRHVTYVHGLPVLLLEEAERGGADAVQAALDRYLELGAARRRGGSVQHRAALDQERSPAGIRPFPITAGDRPGATRP